MTIDNGEALQAARKELDLTCAELADRLRLTGANAKDAVREMEEGKRSISGPVGVAVELMVDRARMRHLLDRYGKHDGLCARIGGYGYCNCGLEAALD